VDVLQFIEEKSLRIYHTIPQCPLQFMKLYCGQYINCISVRENVLKIGTAVQQLRHEDDHSLPSSADAEVKNVCS
jgi:hypothetical protein